jgi:predicted DNA binding CopG/RHH family protein
MTKTSNTQSTAEGRRPSRIPTFNTLEEEAEFWDTHDSAEYEDEMEIVTDVRFVPARPKKAITVRLEQSALETLSRQAREQGVGLSSLIRQWILDRPWEAEKHSA